MAVGAGSVGAETRSERLLLWNEFTWTAFTRRGENKIETESLGRLEH
jgi:hypothetical protein